MDLNRLTRQLRREVKANPGKATLLGVLLAVALYYWIPLVAKWLSPSDKLKTVHAQSVASAALVQTPEEPRPLSGGNPTTIPNTQQQTPEAFPAWDQLVQWRQADPRTQPVQLPTGPRDPFHRADPESVSAGKDGPTATKSLPSGRGGNTGAQPKANAPPESLNVELTSIVVGPNRRIALINGRPYQEGNTLVFVQDGQPWEFRLWRILPNRIVLQWNDRRYEVKLHTSPSNGEIQIDSLGENKTP